MLPRFLERLLNGAGMVALGRRLDLVECLPNPFELVFQRGYLGHELVALALQVAQPVVGPFG